MLQSVCPVCTIDIYTHIHIIIYGPHDTIDYISMYISMVHTILGNEDVLLWYSPQHVCCLWHSFLVELSVICWLHWAWSQMTQCSILMPNQCQSLNVYTASYEYKFSPSTCFAPWPLLTCGLYTTWPSSCVDNDSYISCEVPKLYLVISSNKTKTTGVSLYTAQLSVCSYVRIIMSWTLPSLSIKYRP